MFPVGQSDAGTEFRVLNVYSFSSFHSKGFSCVDDYIVETLNRERMVRKCYPRFQAQRFPEKTIKISKE